MKLGQEIRVVIERLNNKAVGIAKYQDKNVYIADTLVGDEVIAKISDVRDSFVKAELKEVIKDSYDRVQPECQYYSKCGGCNLQHMSNENYQNFKNEIVKDLLVELEISDALLKPMITTGFGDRRRVNFKVSFDKEVLLGFFRSETNDIVDIEKCLVASESINNLIKPLRNFITALQIPNIVKTIAVTELSSGLDLVIETKEYFTKKDKALINDFCAKNNIARFMQITSGQEMMLFSSSNCFVNLADYQIGYPAGGFLQATKLAETKINELILRHLAPHYKIADLFCGLGTYSFSALHLVNYVSGYEGGQNMVAMAQNAVEQNNLADKMRFFCRDLFKRPLDKKELNKFDLVIINPPRDGAKNQVLELAKSRVEKIIMVSCNPDSFKRDAKILLQQGYALINLTPIDQFFYNKHLELVGIFAKADCVKGVDNSKD